MLPEFWRRFLTEILIWGLLAMSSDILIGYTGMVSFGHSAFFGLGIYGAAAALLIGASRPISGWRSLCGLVAAAAVAAFVAYFSTRLRDIYFAITTLIFSQIFYVIIFTWTEVTGGENGLTFSRPPLAIPGLFSFRFTTETLHWFVLAVVTLSISSCGASLSRHSAWYCSRSARTRRGPARSAIRWSATRSWR